MDLLEQAHALVARAEEAMEATHEHLFPHSFPADSHASTDDTASGDGVRKHPATPLPALLFRLFVEPPGPRGAVHKTSGATLGGRGGAEAGEAI